MNYINIWYHTPLIYRRNILNFSKSEYGNFNLKVIGFHKHFQENLYKRRVKHMYIYPRYPKINGYIERSNRSLSEEIIEDNLSKAYEIHEFNRALIDHLMNVQYR